MKIKFEFEKANLGRLAIAMALVVTMYFMVGFSLWAMAAFAVIYFGIKSLNVEPGEKEWVSYLMAVVMIGVSSIFTTYLIQYLLLEKELREKLSDTKLVLNILCCLVVFLVVQIAVKKISYSCIISHVFLLSMAGIDYFVYLFRGNEFIFSDIRSVQTGLSVAANYQFVLDDRAAYVILISACYIALMRKLPFTFEKRRWETAACVVLIFLCVFHIADKTAGIVTETWEQKGSYRNGYVLNFMLSIRDSFVAAPDGYSKEAVQVLEQAYSKGDGETANTVELEKKPTIIVVMSESYADLTVVGDFRTNQDVTPFYDSLTENTIKGYALSSVFGAKTPNSEWEFMTGNSMAFLPAGSVVYQQYISHEPNSIVSDMKREGYTCVAMHPYYATGWSRNTVYPNLGFDEMHFIEDFDQSALLREYITDQELYEEIIREYEQKRTNENLFLMSITMQNHGGYTDTYDNFRQDVRMLGINYPDVNQYLSLLHESDAALEYLITYFENVDEPVEIVFFGDHQPSLDTSFYRTINGKGLSGLTETELENLYTVPFFIWTNYDTPEEEVEITSFNFLSTMAMERAGLQLPAYHQFLADLYEVVPAINARGYYSKQEGGFIHVEDATGVEAEWISDYQILQYNNMFDSREKSKLFFPYLDSFQDTN